MQPFDGKPKVELTKPKGPEGLTIKWKDGLPDDPLERAQIEQILVTTGVTSKFSSIMRILDGDADAAEEEMQRIREEQAEQMMGEVALAGAEAGATAMAEPATDADEVGQSAKIMANMRSERGQQKPKDGARTEGS